MKNLLEELSEKLLGAAVFTCVPEAEGSKEQKTEERKVAKTLSQLVSQIAAQRKKIEASRSKVALEKEMEETEALLDIAKAAMELHTQLHKAGPHFKEMTAALETLMVELPEKHVDHTVWIKCLRAQATFQNTRITQAIMEASFVSVS